jgi:ribosomal protein S27AE
MAMRDGVCPECGGTDIYKRNGWFHNIVVAFMPPKTQVYVCGNCGHISEFIEQGNHLNHVKSKWTKLGATEKRKRDE